MIVTEDVDFILRSPRLGLPHKVGLLVKGFTQQHECGCKWVWLLDLHCNGKIFAGSTGCSTHKLALRTREVI